MEEQIANFLIGLGVDPDTARVKEFDSALSRAKSTMRDVVEVGTAVTAGVGAVGGALFAASKRAADTAVKMARQAESVGMARVEYEALARAASRFGVEGEDVQDVLSVVADRADDAMRGTKSFVEAFELVDIQARELEGLEPEQIFYKYAAAIRQTEDDTRRLASAERLLGGQLGQRLMPLLLKGRDGLRRMTERLKDLGTVMGEGATERARQFESQLFFAKQTLSAVVRTIGMAAMPAITDLIDRFLAWYEANQQLVDQEIREVIRDLTDTIIDFAENLPANLDALQSLIEKFGGWADTLELVGSLIEQAGIVWLLTKLISLGSAVWSMASALGGVGAVFSSIAGQIGIIMQVGLGTWLSSAAAAAAVFVAKAAAIAAVIAAVVLVVEDLWTYFQGGDSLTGRFLEWAKSTELGAQAAKTFAEFVDVLSVAFGALGDAAVAIWPYIRSAAAAVFEALGMYFQGVWATAKPILSLLLSAFRSIFGVWEGLLHALQGDWEEAWNAIKASTLNQIKAINQFFRTVFNALFGRLKKVYSTVKSYASAIASALPGADIAMSAFDAGVTLATGSPNVRTGGGSTGGGSPNVEYREGDKKFEIHPSPGMDEEQLAKEVDRRVRQSETDQSKRIRKNIGAGGEQ